VLDQDYDKASYALEGIILRPLRAFGLLECRSDTIPHQRLSKAHYYRKTPLFDRFLSFDVTTEPPDATKH